MPIVHHRPFIHQQTPVSRPPISVTLTDTLWSPVTLSMLLAQHCHVASEKSGPTYCPGLLLIPCHRATCILPELLLWI